MSATRDTSQPVTFVFTSLHDIYKKGLNAAREAQLPALNATAAHADLDHPRFGGQAPEGHEKLYSMRSETYRVLRPKGRPEARKGALRSTQRVLKAGEVQVRPIQEHHPVTFLRKAPLAKQISPVPAGTRAEAQAALQRIQKAAPEATRNALEGVRSTLSRLDRLQSRLHFLLREIQDYSGSNSEE